MCINNYLKWSCCGSILSFLCLEFIIIHYHTQKQRKIKIEPRMKLNHSSHFWAPCCKHSDDLEYIYDSMHKTTFQSRTDNFIATINLYLSNLGKDAVISPRSRRDCQDLGSAQSMVRYIKISLRISIRSCQKFCTG